jgi:hypothetical protein
MPKTPLSLDDNEVQLLLRSLDHCLATCTTKSTSSAPCGDCEAAKKLRQKLADSSKP